MAVAPQSDPDKRDGFIDRVRTAQDRLAKAVARAGLKNDPYADVVAAQSDVMDVLVEAALLVGRPITAEDVERLNKAAGQSAARNAIQEMNFATKAIARQMAWKTLAQCGGIGALLLLAGGVIDRWALPHPAPDLSGMTCADQTDRSRVCWIVVTPAPPAAPPPTARGRQ